MVTISKDNWQQALESKTNIETFEINDIENLIEEYPAFNTAYIFKALLLKKRNGSAFEEQLTRIASFTKDRAKLHDYIYEVVNEKSTRNIETEKTNYNTEEDIVGIKDTSAVEVQEIVTDVEVETPPLLEKTSELKESIANEGKAIAIKEETAEKQKSSNYLTWLKNKKKANTTTKPDNIAIPLDGVSQIEAEMHQEIKASSDPLEQFISAQISRKKRLRKKKPKNQELIKIENNSLIISETYAEILTLQQKYNEAIDVYLQLGLKYPQKSIYFARQIEKIKTYL